MPIIMLRGLVVGNNILTAHAPRTRGGIRARASSNSTPYTEVDKLLAAGDESKVVEWAKGLQSSGSLRAFGNGRNIPKRNYTLDELRLNKIQPQEVIAPKDKTIDGVTQKLQILTLIGLGGLIYEVPDIRTVFYSAFTLSFLFVFDTVGFQGGLSALLLDSAARVPFIGGNYGQRVALHEAGHFLIAYLLGIMPKGYTLSSLDAYSKYKTLSVQAGTLFCDEAFQKEVTGGKLKASSLDKFACIALAGVATEYLRFGAAEGGLNDIQQLDRLLMALGFTAKKAEGQVRWALLNTVQLLNRYRTVHDQLAVKMSANAPVSECIALIEEQLKNDRDLLEPSDDALAYLSADSSSSGPAA